MNLAWLSLCFVNWHCCSLHSDGLYCATVALLHALSLPRWHLFFLISAPCLVAQNAFQPFNLFLGPPWARAAHKSASPSEKLLLCFYAICWINWKVFTLKESESPNIVLSCLPWMAFIVLGASQHAPKMHLASSSPHCFPLHYFLIELDVESESDFCVVFSSTFNR